MYVRSTKPKLVALLTLPLASFLAVAQPAAFHVGGNVLDPQRPPPKRVMALIRLNFQGLSLIRLVR